MVHGTRHGPSTRRIRRRVIRRLDEAERLLAFVADDDATVAATATHDVRLRCKEVRALLRLLRDDGSTERCRVDSWIAAAGASLGSRRDAQVTLEVVRDLTGSSGSVESAPAGPTAPAARRIRRARRHVERWPTNRRTEPLVDGLTRSYRLARRRYRDVLAAPGDDAVHAWRRAVKRLGYQAHVVRARAPDELGTLAAGLARLGTVLGDHHDLAHAIGHIATHPVGFDAAAATATAHGRQAALAAEAVLLGAGLFEPTPHAFARQLRAWSRAADRVSS